jgi:hypothetical protein
VVLTLCLTGASAAHASRPGQDRDGKATAGRDGPKSARGKDDLFIEMLDGSKADGPRVPDAGEGQNTGECVSAVEAECVSVAPEPSAMVLVASGLVGIAVLGLVRHRRRITS